MLQQSSTAMGATFDPELLHTIGLKLLAPEAKLKAASLALAPTCNIQRVRQSSMIRFIAFLTLVSSEPPRRQGEAGHSSPFPNSRRLVELRVLL